VVAISTRPPGGQFGKLNPVDLPRGPQRIFPAPKFRQEPLDPSKECLSRLATWVHPQRDMGRRKPKPSEVVRDFCGYEQCVELLRFNRAPIQPARLPNSIPPDNPHSVRLPPDL
jgi:hypothetical protein